MRSLALEKTTALTKERSHPGLHEAPGGGVGGHPGASFGFLAPRPDRPGAGDPGPGAGANPCGKGEQRECQGPLDKKCRCERDGHPKGHPKGGRRSPSDPLGAPIGRSRWRVGDPGDVSLGTLKPLVARSRRMSNPSPHFIAFRSERRGGPPGSPDPLNPLGAPLQAPVKILSGASEAGTEAASMSGGVSSGISSGGTLAAFEAPGRKPPSRRDPAARTDPPPPNAGTEPPCPI